MIECHPKNQSDLQGILRRCDSGPELNKGTKKPFPIMGRALIEGLLSSPSPLPKEQGEGKQAKEKGYLCDHAFLICD
jgi:hypothetical protein